MESSNEMKVPQIDETKLHQMCILNKQIFANAAIIYVVLIIIITLKGYKKILCIDDLEEINKITKCNDSLTKFSILVVLIVTFYYLYQSIENYQSSSSCVDKNYVTANTLSVIASIIRFWTIYSSNNKNLNEDETETEII